MGWTVLYIAFGIVALWLLGEVLLQYKARLRWRLLAFSGFVGVVIGALIPSVLVIAVGAIAFATGQTYVTLSFRRGFSTGWAIGGKPGESRRRRAGGNRAATRKPTLEVSDLTYEQPAPPSGPPSGPANPAPSVTVTNPADSTNPAPSAASAIPDFSFYESQPLPDETGQYGVYVGGTGPAAGQDDGDRYPRHGAPQPQYAAHDPYTGRPPADQDPYAGQYDYGTDQQRYPAYSDPYIGTGTTAASGPYGPEYGTGEYQNHDGHPGQQPYAADPYAQEYGSDTPPGGVWVPQQRENEQPPHVPLPPHAPTADRNPYPNDYDGQNFRY
ncbi:hypothetical protein [Streptomyces sp. DT171]|uniref:hypothetical protein n=1 Tax=Streptomyces sp. DT171 TaxID=3416524 RepID=UPI003CEAC57C